MDKNDSELEGTAPMERTANLELFQPKVVLFDLDGTLVDTMDVYADLAAATIQAFFGLPFDHARAAYLKSSGRPFSDQLALIVPGLRDPSVACNAFEQAKVISATSVSLSESTTLALRSLRRHGIGIAISSNNRQSIVDSFCRRCPFPFDLALGYDEDRKAGKPHFESAARFFDCSPRDLLFVGDSLYDAEIAQNYNVPFVGLVGTFSQVDFQMAFPDMVCASSISDIISLLSPPLKSFA